MYVFHKRATRKHLTTRQSASLAVQGEVKRGHINAAPKAPLHCGGEALATKPEFFTFMAISGSIVSPMQIMDCGWRQQLMHSAHHGMLILPSSRGLPGRI